jgi:hypothetical protein
MLNSKKIKIKIKNKVNHIKGAICGIKKYLLIGDYFSLTY